MTSPAAAGMGKQDRQFTGLEPLIGIIANPASGKDIRRLTGPASVVDNNEKANVVRRILAGIAALGNHPIRYMPDHFGIVSRARDPAALDVAPIDMHCRGHPADTVEATRALVALDAAAIVVLGGDGTVRLVGRESGETPIVAVSTGTNNAIPEWIDGTLAGLAAALVAQRALPLESLAPRTKRIEFRGRTASGEFEDIALVDGALLDEPHIGSRAVLRPDLLRHLFLTRAVPGVIGLSSIGAMSHPIADDAPHGLWMELGARSPRTVLAPIAPGVIWRAPIHRTASLRLNRPITVEARGGVLALDGEREHKLTPDSLLSVTITRGGPRLARIRDTIGAATSAGLFVSPRVENANEGAFAHDDEAQ